MLSWILFWVIPFQDICMIALPGLIISILFPGRITYIILAHFIQSINTVKSHCLPISTQYSVLM